MINEQVVSKNIYSVKRRKIKYVNYISVQMLLFAGDLISSRLKTINLT